MSDIGYWEHFSHDADIGVRGVGRDLAGAFAMAACALTAVVTHPEQVRPLTAMNIRVPAQDKEFLLVEWLNAIVYAMSVHHMLFSRYEVRIDNSGLQATIYGEPVDVQRHRPAVEVKGATLTELKVCQDVDGRWVAQCIVDV